MLEDELFLRAGFQQDRKLIKAADSARQFGPIQEVYDHGSFLTPNRVKKSVLDVLWCLFTVRHVETRGWNCRSRGCNEITTGIFALQEIGGDVR
ncbi:MAG TPA: hypothetical protein VJR02_03700, partial [Pyrinomonadaceae bacterium]|nr:hypothetical protein [Pyrinomonadaceae bacterium]